MRRSLPCLKVQRRLQFHRNKYSDIGKAGDGAKSIVGSSVTPFLPKFVMSSNSSCHNFVFPPGFVFVKFYLMHKVGSNIFFISTSGHTSSSHIFMVA